MKTRILFTLLIVAGSTAWAQNDKGFEISKNLEIFANVYKNLHTNYVDDVDPGKTMKVAIDAMLASMDPYTNYFAESDMEDVKMQVLGQYGGIGSLIHQENDMVIVAFPVDIGFHTLCKILNADLADTLGVDIFVVYMLSAHKA